MRLLLSTRYGRKAVVVAGLAAILLLALAPFGSRHVFALDPGKAITQYSHDVWGVADGLPQSSVQAILQTRDGYLWLGTREGLARFDGVRFTVCDKRNTRAIKNNVVNALIESRDGSLWVATEGGLNRFKGGELTSYSTADGLSNNFIHAICEGSEGSLWVGTSGGGLNRLKDGAFTVYSTATGLSDDVVFAVYQDRGGSLWVGTNNGLNRFRDATFTAYTTRNGLATDTVWSISETPAGDIWIGTVAGLNRFHGGKFTAYTMRDGLPGDNVFSILAYREGGLWLATYNGLAHFRDGRFTVYTTEQGLVANFVRTVCEGRNGGLWIGTEGGLSRFKDGKFISYTTKDGLAHNRIKALHEDREYEEGAGLGFTLQPRFHQKLWFYALCAACLALTGWGLYRLRVRQVEQRYALLMAERNRLAREMHDTLIQGITGASALLETASMVLPTSPDKAKNYLDKTRHQLRRSLGEARQALWNLRHQTPLQESFATRLHGAVERLMADASVELQFEVHGTPRGLPQAVEDNLLRICQESVANAVAHAGARHILVELHFEPKSARLAVEDDGRGFDISQSAMADNETGVNGHHFGLLGIRERAKDVGGECLVRSAPGEGTEVSVTVPVD